MTKIINMKKYCKKCKREYEVPVILSTNSYALKNDPKLRKLDEEGNLFKNLCPVCKEELVNKKDE